MPTILKSVNLEYTHTVEVGSGKVEVTPSPDATLSVVPQAEPVEVVVVPPPAEPEEDLAEVQKQAEMMLNQARSQVSIWQQEARQAGWQAGYDEARQAALDSLAETLATARQIAQSAVEAREQLLRQSQAELHRLAMAIARKIIGHQIEIAPEVVAAILQQVIEDACVREACVIRVNPDDYRVVQDHWAQIAAGHTADNSWELIADRRISRGGCIIEVNGGSIDARLETQLQQIERAFEQVGT